VNSAHGPDKVSAEHRCAPEEFKAVDWMHVILCSEDVLLAGRIPSDYFDIIMA